MDASALIRRAATGRARRWLGRAWTLLGALLALGVGVTLGQMLTRGTMVPVTLFGWLLYIVAAFLNPFLGLMLWLTSAPYSRFIYLDIRGGTFGVPDGIPDLTLTRIVLAALFTLLTAQWVTGQRRLARFTLLDWAMLLFLGALFIAVPLHYRGFKNGLVLFIDSYGVAVLAYFLAKNLVQTRTQRRFLLGVLAFTAAHLALVAIHEATTGEIWFYYSSRSFTYTSSLRRLVGLLGSSAVFGTIFAMLFPFVAHAAFRTKNVGLKVVLLAISGATAVGLFFTYNRASYIGLAWALLVMIFYAPRSRKYLLPLLAVGILAVIVQWNALQTNAVVAERLSAQGPLEYRSEVLAKVWPLIFKAPILGRGFDNFQAIYELEALGHLELSLVPYFPHNTFIWVWFSAGLLALIPFVAIFLLVAWEAWHLCRHPRPDLGVDRGVAAALLAAWGAYLVQSLVTDTIYAYYMTTMFFVLVGAVVGARGEQGGAEQG